MTAIPRYVITVLGGIGVAAFSYYGFREYDIVRRCTPQPELITLREFIARGPSGNPYVTLTDFHATDGSAVESSGRTGYYTGAWVPVVPPEEADAASGRPVTVLIHPDNVLSDVDLQWWYRRAHHATGIVRVGSPVPSQPGIDKHLGATHPGTNFSRCMILNEGERPGGRVTPLLLMCSASLLLILAVGIWFYPPWPSKLEPAPPRRRRRYRGGDDRDNDRRRYRDDD